jgi:hypothetical protein
MMVLEAIKLFTYCMIALYRVIAIAGLALHGRCVLAC